MFKKLLIFIITFFIYTNFSYGDVMVSNICPPAWQLAVKSFILWWDNTNNIANKNTKLVCATSSWYDAGLLLYNDTWGFLYSQYNNYCWASGWYNFSEHSIVDYFGDFYIFSKWSKPWYTGASLHVIRKNGVNTWHNLQNCWTTYNGTFSFDQDYFYFWNIEIEKSSWNITTAGLGVLGSSIWTNNNYVKFLLTNKAIVKSSIDNNSIIYQYDTLTNSVLTEVISFPDIPIFWGFNIFKIWDLDEYYYTSWYNTYRIINNNTVNNSFSGVLSYISTDGVDDTLHLIPDGAIIDVDFSYNKHNAYVSWTGTTKRIYYILNWILYFNDNLTVINAGEIIDNTWIDTWWGTWGDTWTGVINIWTWTGAISYDQSIWDFDTDGDGDVELLNWEIFIWLANLIKYYFSKMIAFFWSLADLIQRLGDINTTELKTISSFFIMQSHADNEIASMFNDVDKIAYRETSIWKIDIILKGWIAFFILVFGMSFFILVNKKKSW